MNRYPYRDASSDSFQTPADDRGPPLLPRAALFLQLPLDVFQLAHAGAMALG